MTKQALLSLVICLIFAGSLIGQSNREQFLKLSAAKDLVGQLKLLNAWEAATPDDPELYVSYFNYYFVKSRTETLSLTAKAPDGTSVPLRKDDGKVAGYLGSDTTFNKADIDAGLDYIERGITKFPNRLDMRFGKTFVLGQIRDHDRFCAEIVKTIDRSGENKNAWLWLDNKPVEKPRELMLGSIQDYVVQLFDAGDKEVAFIKPIAEAVLKHYPDHVESLSNLSIYYMVKGDFDAALVPLLKAEKLAPQDFVIIGNIAWAYFNKHDKPNASKYYEKLLIMGDERAKQQAASKLKEMKDWK